MFNVIHVIFTVHLVTCEHSVAHLQCGKIMFLFFLCMVHYYQKHKQFIFNFLWHFSISTVSLLFLLFSSDVGQIIHVYGADYGRRDQTTCSYKRPPSQIQNTDCSNPTNIVSDRYTWPLFVNLYLMFESVEIKIMVYFTQKTPRFHVLHLTFKSAFTRHSVSTVVMGKTAVL